MARADVSPLSVSPLPRFRPSLPPELKKYPVFAAKTTLHVTTGDNDDLIRAVLLQLRKDLEQIDLLSSDGDFALSWHIQDGTARMLDGIHLIYYDVNGPHNVSIDALQADLIGPTLLDCHPVVCLAAARLRVMGDYFSLPDGVKLPSKSKIDEHFRLSAAHAGRVPVVVIRSAISSLFKSYSSGEQAIIFCSVLVEVSSTFGTTSADTRLLEELTTCLAAFGASHRDRRSVCRALPSLAATFSPPLAGRDSARFRDSKAVANVMEEAAKTTLASSLVLGKVHCNVPRVSKPRLSPSEKARSTIQASFKRMRRDFEKPRDLMVALRAEANLLAKNFAGSMYKIFAIAGEQVERFDTSPDEAVLDDNEWIMSLELVRHYAELVEDAVNCKAGIRATLLVTKDFSRKAAAIVNGKKHPVQRNGPVRVVVSGEMAKLGRSMRRVRRASGGRRQATPSRAARGPDRVEMIKDTREAKQRAAEAAEEAKLREDEVVKALESHVDAVDSRAKPDAIDVYVGRIFNPKLRATKAVAETVKAMTVDTENKAQLVPSTLVCPVHTLDESMTEALTNARGRFSRATDGTVKVVNAAAQHAFRRAHFSANRTINQPVDVFQKYATSSAWSTRMGHTKWQERRNAVQELLDDATKAPIIVPPANSDQSDVVGLLRRALNDDDVVVVGLAVRALGMLARGLAPNVNWAGQTVSVLVEKFKDKNPQVLTAVHETLVLLTTTKAISLADREDVVVAAATHKVASVRTKTAAWLTDATVLADGVLSDADRSVAAAFCKALGKDKDCKVRTLAKKSLALIEGASADKKSDGASTSKSAPATGKKTPKKAAAPPAKDLASLPVSFETAREQLIGWTSEAVVDKVLKSTSWQERLEALEAVEEAFQPARAGAMSVVGHQLLTKENNFKAYNQLLGIMRRTMAHEDAHWVAPSLVSAASAKLVDAKNAAAAAACMDAIVEAMGPRWTALTVLKAEHKSPKIQANTVQWVETLAVEYGPSACGIGALLPDAITLSKHANADVRKAATALVATLSRSPASPILETDIVPLLTSRLFDEMAHSDWRVRQEAMEKIGDMVRGKRIAPKLGGLIPAMRGMLADTKHKDLVKTGVKLVGTLATALGSPIERAGRTLLAPLLACIGDSKKPTRDAVVATLDLWLAQLSSIDSMLAGVPTVLASTSPTGQQALLEWLSVHEEMLGEAKKSDDLAGMIKPLVACYLARSAGMRSVAERVLSIVMATTGPKLVQRECETLRSQDKASLTAFLKKNGIESDEDKRAKRAAAASEPTTPRRTPRGKSSSSRTSKVNEPTSSRGGPATPSGPVPPFNILHGKDKRKTANDRKVRWAFDEPSSEYVEFLRTQATPCVSQQLHAQLFSADFKKHGAALDAMTAALEDETPESTIDNLDIVFKWLSLRVTGSNMTILLKSLEYTRQLIAFLASNGHVLSDYEASCILPFLVDRVGHNNDKARKSIGELIHSLVDVYVPSKAFSLIARGLRAKNMRTVTDCMEEMAVLIGEHGLSVCTAPDVSFIGDGVQALSTAAADVPAAFSSLLSTLAFFEGERLVIREQFSFSLVNSTKEFLTLADADTAKAVRGRAVALRTIASLLALGVPDDVFSLDDIGSRILTSPHGAFFFDEALAACAAIRAAPATKHRLFSRLRTVFIAAGLLNTTSVAADRLARSVAMTEFGLLGALSGSGDVTKRRLLDYGLERLVAQLDDAALQSSLNATRHAWQAEALKYASARVRVCIASRCPSLCAGLAESILDGLVQSGTMGRILADIGASATLAKTTDVKSVYFRARKVIADDLAAALRADELVRELEDHVIDNVLGGDDVDNKDTGVVNVPDGDSIDKCKFDDEGAQTAHAKATRKKKRAALLDQVAKRVANTVFSSPAFSTLIRSIRISRAEIGSMRTIAAFYILILAPGEDVDGKIVVRHMSDLVTDIVESISALCSSSGSKSGSKSGARKASGSKSASKSASKSSDGKSGSKSGSESSGGKSGSKSGSESDGGKSDSKSSDGKSGSKSGSKSSDGKSASNSASDSDSTTVTVEFLNDALLARFEPADRRPHGKCLSFARRPFTSSFLAKDLTKFVQFSRSACIDPHWSNRSAGAHMQLFQWKLLPEHERRRTVPLFFLLHLVRRRLANADAAVQNGLAVQAVVLQELGGRRVLRGQFRYSNVASHVHHTVFRLRISAFLPRPAPTVSDPSPAAPLKEEHLVLGTQILLGDATDNAALDVKLKDYYGTYLKLTKSLLDGHVRVKDGLVDDAEIATRSVADPICTYHISHM